MEKKKGAATKAKTSNPKVFFLPTCKCCVKDTNTHKLQNIVRDDDILLWPLLGRVTKHSWHMFCRRDEGKEFEIKAGTFYEAQDISGRVMPFDITTYSGRKYVYHHSRVYLHYLLFWHRYMMHGVHFVFEKNKVTLTPISLITLSRIPTYDRRSTSWRYSEGHRLHEEYEGG